MEGTALESLLRIYLVSFFNALVSIQTGEHQKRTRSQLQYHVCVLVIIYRLSISVDCEWAEWVEGICSTTCGAGQQNNTRVKLTEETNGGTCTGESSELLSCLDVECPGKF